VSVAILGANGAPGNLRTEGDGLADGIVVTPSHNPPRDGGFKYNPPHGGPADTDATGWIAARANELLDSGEWKNVPRVTGSDLLHDPNIKPFDYLDYYVSQLDQVIDIEAIRKAGVRIGADPLGGASIDYWAAIGEHYGLDLTVVNPEVDPAWPFMTLDWDGKIRMDCSSPYAMASLREAMTPDAEGNTPYDIATGNDADSDRHGIVTPDGLMNPNHFLAVAIEYLFTHRPGWGADAAVGKTLVSSALIDRVVASMGRDLIEVPVGFKYFVPGLLSGTVGFGGEESAGASFLRKDGTVWSTDKDGIILALLASEILAVTGKTPSQLHEEQVERFGASAYARIDAAASREEAAKARPPARPATAPVGRLALPLAPPTGQAPHPTRPACPPPVTVTVVTRGIRRTEESVRLIRTLDSPLRASRTTECPALHIPVRLVPPTRLRSTLLRLTSKTEPPAQPNPVPHLKHPALALPGLLPLPQVHMAPAVQPRQERVPLPLRLARMETPAARHTTAWQAKAFQQPMAFPRGGTSIPTSRVIPQTTTSTRLPTRANRTTQVIGRIPTT